MKKLLLLLLISNACFGQVVDSYLNIQNLKSGGQLSPNQTYMINDLGKIVLRAKNDSTFYKTPVNRTPFGHDFDEETFDFDSKKLMGIDNVSCVARCQNSVWSIINDAGHCPQNVASVSDNLYLHYAKSYDKVLDFQTSFDEAYAASNYNITFGASVGLTFSAIYFYKTVIVNGQLVKVQMTKQELSIAWSNIFISGRFGKIIQL